MPYPTQATVTITYSGFAGVSATGWTGPTNGLVDRWQMDSGSISGATLADLGPGGNNATLVGSPSSVSSPAGAFAATALSFDGSTQWASLASNIGVTAAGPWSVGFWANITDVTFQPNGAGTFPRIACFYDGTNAFDIAEVSDSGAGAGSVGAVGAEVPALGGTPYVSSNSVAFVNGTWEHVVVTFDGAAFIIYQNGTSLGVTGDTSSAAPVSANFIATRSASDRQYKGSLYQLVVYNRVLTSGEVTTLFNAK